MKVDCTRCKVFAFKHAFCEDDFCEKYCGEGNEYDFVQMLSTAEPKEIGEAVPQWTPVKKGYPTESGYYNVTIMGYLDDRLEPAIEYYSPNTARDKKRWKAINVIAWRPADVYRE